jgi:hypothetical protein
MAWQAVEGRQRRVIGHLEGGQNFPAEAAGLTVEKIALASVHAAEEQGEQAEAGHQKDGQGNEDFRQGEAVLAATGLIGHTPSEPCG